MESAFKINESIAQQYNENIKRMIEQLGEHLKSVFRKKEDNILTAYKDQLLKTRQEFNRLQEAKSEDAIKKSVLQQKNHNQKQCQYSLQQSLQISKTYQMMKSKLNEVQDDEHQLKLQIKYLEKQCHNISRKRDLLKKELQELQRDSQKQNIENESFILQFNQNKYGKDSEKKGGFTNSKLQMAKKVQKQKLLKSVKLSDGNEKHYTCENGQLKSTKWNEQYEKNMRNKIEQIKDFKQSVIHEQSSLQAIFSDYNISKQYSRKQKLTLIQQIFSREDVKEKIYELLFCEKQLIK